MELGTKKSLRGTGWQNGQTPRRILALNRDCKKSAGPRKTKAKPIIKRGIPPIRLRGVEV